MGAQTNFFGAVLDQVIRGIAPETASSALLMGVNSPSHLNLENIVSTHHLFHKVRDKYPSFIFRVRGGFQRSLIAGLDEVSLIGGIIFWFVYCSCKSCSFVELWLVARALEYRMRSSPSSAFQSPIMSNVSLILFDGLVHIMRRQKYFTLNLLSVEDMPYILSHSIHRDFVLQ